MQFWATETRAFLEQRRSKLSAARDRYAVGSDEYVDLQWYVDILNELLANPNLE